MVFEGGGGMKFPKTWVGAVIFENICGVKQKGGGEKTQKSETGIFFILIFSLLGILVTDTAFRKSSLGNLFLKKVVSGTYQHWSFYTDSILTCY